MSVPARTTAAPSGDIMEKLLIGGDLSKLAPSDRLKYYNAVCDSLGLNPLTQPFAYITLNGKLQLYALRACTDQLRKINAVSLAILSRDVADGILTMHVRATLPDGRSDEDLGAVAFPETLKGEARANAELKAITKAKRRATLSICGLGWLDETEIADIPASAKRPAPPAPNVMIPHNSETGEIIESESAAEPVSRPAADAAPADHSALPNAPAGAVTTEPTIEEVATYDRELAEAAKLGSDQLKSTWDNVPRRVRPTLKSALDRRHKPAAAEADKQAVTTG